MHPLLSNTSLSSKQSNQIYTEYTRNTSKNVYLWGSKLALVVNELDLILMSIFPLKNI